MSRIHLNRNRRSLGQFTPEEVANGLKSGEFLPTDLAWREPMESWKPLSEFTDLPEPTTVTIAEIIPPIPPVIVPEATIEPKWERREGTGSIKALRETISQVASTPSKVFSSLNPATTLREPLKYFFILWTLSTWISSLYQIVIFLIKPSLLLQNTPSKLTQGEMITGMFMSLIFVPLFALILPFILAGIFHVCLSVVGAGEKTFATTFRVFCYAWGTASLLNLVPACGVYLSLGGAIILLVIGFQKAHQIDGFRAAVAVLPVLLLCFGGMLLAVATSAYLAGLK